MYLTKAAVVGFLFVGAAAWATGCSNSTSPQLDPNGIAYSFAVVGCNRLAAPDSVLAQAQQLAAELAAGPSFANAMTKRMLEMEWAMSVETAIEAEAVAQALCMETQDFARAFHAFAAKQKPVFEGN